MTSKFFATIHPNTVPLKICICAVCDKPQYLENLFLIARSDRNDLHAFPNANKDGRFTTQDNYVYAVLTHMSKSLCNYIHVCMSHADVGCTIFRHCIYLKNK